MRSEIIRGPLGHDFSEVAERLAKLGEGRLVFVSNRGNAGDCLIATGTFRLFESLGFRPEMGDLNATYPEAHLVYSGGGNLVENYKNARRFISRHLDTCRSFTLLPHSIRGNIDLLNQLDERFTLFARELPSFEHAERYAKDATVRLAHDMAFMNDVSRLGDLLATESFRFAPPLSSEGMQQRRSTVLWRAKVLRRRLISGALPSGPVLNAYRTDTEGTRTNIPKPNFDLSWRYQYVQDPSLALSGRIARALVQALEPYETIRTDRLHVAVPAALLGKTVEMGDNSYGKLSGVYEHSMKEIFPKVRLT